MSTGKLTHIQQVRMLYKSILRLHRGLPNDLRLLGDQYAKEEFQKHKDASPEATATFICEWAQYALSLTKQLGVKGPTTGSRIGKPLSPGELENFRAEQISLLYDLMQETRKPKS